MSSPPPPLPTASPREKPFVLIAITGAAIVLGLLRFREIVTAFAKFQENGIIETFGTIGLNVSVIVFSGLTIGTITKDHLKNTKPLTFYLWCMLLLPLFIAMQRLLGFYIKHVPLPAELLFFGVLAELGQFLIPIALLVWISASRDLRAFFAQHERQV